MNILIDTFKTFFGDIGILLKECINNGNKLCISLTDIFYINNIAKKIFKLLCLEKIPIKFYFRQTNCFFGHYEGGYFYVKPYLSFGLALFLNEAILNELVDNTDYKFNGREDKLFFVVAHEIGHYLQCANYSRWYFRNSENRKIELAFCSSQKSYRKIKLERVADRLAIGIYKRLKNKKESV
jgi:hypothetical protein